MSEFKKSDRKAIFSDLKGFCHFSKDYDFIEITEWSNGEGFDIYVDTSKDRQTISVTDGEFHLIKKLVKKLRK